MGLPRRPRLGIRSLAVFGSVARGQESSTSDIDLVVDFTSEDHLFDRFMGVKEAAEAQFGRPVDLLTRASLRNPIFRAVVEREQVMLHG